jgi:hypothetical protein
MVAGNGEKVTLRQVAQWGDACNLKDGPPLSDESIPDSERAASVERLLRVLTGHCERLGRDFDEILRTHFTLYLNLGETMESSRAKANGLDTSRSTSPGTRARGTTSMLVADPDRAIRYYQAMVDIGIQYFIVQLDARDAETIELLMTRVAPHVG